MHVALNALPITNRSGTGRYCWGLIHGFISEFSNDARLSIAIPASFSIPNEWRHKKNIHFYSIPISSTIQRIAWEQWALPSFVKKLQCDMLTSPPVR